MGRLPGCWACPRDRSVTSISDGRIHGRGALEPKPAKQVYSFEFKLALVERLLDGESAEELPPEAGLSSPQLLKMGHASIAARTRTHYA